MQLEDTDQMSKNCGEDTKGSSGEKVDSIEELTCVYPGVGK